MADVTSNPSLLRKPHFYFSIAFLVAVGGFWPSFFSKLASTDRAHLIHGVTATLWMTVPILQSWLISQKTIQIAPPTGVGDLAYSGAYPGRERTPHGAIDGVAL
jgi:hypothetical protein